MPALRANRVGGGPLHATGLDFIGKPEHRGHACKRRGWRRGKPPVHPVHGVTSGFATLIRVPGRLRVKAVLYVGVVLCIDRLAMGGVCRLLLGDEGKGGIDGCWLGGRNGCGSRGLKTCQSDRCDDFGPCSLGQNGAPPGLGRTARAQRGTAPRAVIGEGRYR